jgi:hypothetical protein
MQKIQITELFFENRQHWQFEVGFYNLQYVIIIIISIG